MDIADLFAGVDHKVGHLMNIVEKSDSQPSLKVESQKDLIEQLKNGLDKEHIIQRNFNINQDVLEHSPITYYMQSSENSQDKLKIQPQAVPSSAISNESSILITSQPE